MKYLVVNKNVPSDSFLFRNLNVSDYSAFRFGRENLLAILKKNLPLLFADAKLILTDQALENIDLTLEENDSVVYFDMSIFPLDFVLIDNVFAKAVMNKKPVKFFSKNSDKKTFLPLAVSSGLNQEDGLEIDLSGMFVDLRDAESLLQLFFSNFNSRYFNQLKTSSRNYIVKSSSDVKKIKNEFNFLSNLPIGIKSFYPQIGSYEANNDKASYEIEKIYMLDLSRQVINKILQKSDVEKLVEKLFSYMSLLDRKEVTADEFKKVFDEEFLQKNEQRFAQLQKLPVFEDLTHLAKLEGFESVADFHKKLQSEISNFSAKNFLVFSHGDLCFSNILYDPHTTNLKLIDPKGFAAEISQTYRPLHYDLAKLSHSFLGLYDLILYNMVEVKLDGNGLVLDFEIAANYQKILADNFSAFVERLGFDLREIRLLEASLFLSMIPLHQDDKKRMIAQFVQAVKIFKAVK